MLNEFLMNIPWIIVIGMSLNITVNMNLLDDRDRWIYFHCKDKRSSQDRNRMTLSGNSGLFNGKELQ